MPNIHVNDKRGHIKLITNLLRFIPQRVRVLIRRVLGKNEYLSLFPDSKLILLEALKVDNHFPANISQIENLWLPEKQWISYETNTVNANHLIGVNVSFDGIAFKGIDAFAGSYVYPAFYEKFGISYLLDNYKNRTPFLCDPEYEYLLVYDHWSSINYFHWICDSIPKLSLFKTQFPGKKVKVLLPSTAPQYVIDSVQLFDYEPEYIRKDQYAFVRDLWHIDYLSASGLTSPYMTSGIKEMSGKVPCQNKHRKIYISRSESAKRYIENESVLTDLLKSKGFEVIYTEKLSLAEQIKIFKEADTLISSHGAGLTNLVFLPHGAKVIEIGYSDVKKLPACYWTMSNSFGHPYYYIPVPFTDKDSFVMDERGLRLVQEALTSNSE